MFRFSNHLNYGKLVLVRKKVGEGSCALLVMRAPNRKYSEKKHAKPGEPKQSLNIFWGGVGVTVLTGAAVVYAKNNSDARNWLSTHLPWADDFIALIYQENTTYGKAAANKISKATGHIADFMFGKEGITPPKIETRATQDLDADAIKFRRKDYELPPTSFEPLFVEEKPPIQPEVDQPATLVKTEKCEPAKPKPVVITKSLVELEHDMHESTKIAIDSYKTATKLCAAYNTALYRIIEASADDLDKKQFTALSGAQIERDATLVKAKEASAKAKCALETLERMMKAGTIQAPPEPLVITKRYMDQFRTDLEAAERDYRIEAEKSIISDAYWSKVEEARDMFKDELQMLFPGVDLNTRQLNIRGETDLLLLYTLKKVQYLQNELAELQTIRELKLHRAIECHDEKEIIEAKAEDVVKRERVQKELDFQKKALAMRAEADRNLKEQLKKQLETQQAVLQDKLAKKEKEVLSKFNKLVSERLEKDRLMFKQELAALAGKLKAIEQTLKQRAKAEAETRRSQALWAAAEALLAATRRSCASVSVAKEISALENAGKGDKLVQTVLKGISTDVREKGIVTEKNLKDRFDRMERCALKVALVGKEGAILPVYFLSWIQAKLLFSSISEIPKDELDNKPMDFTELDTFDIMLRARYHMERGELPAALRYVNLLQGAARAAAAAWAAAARRHLEVRQAARAVMAHASAAALLQLDKLK